MKKWKAAFSLGDVYFCELLCYKIVNNKCYFLVVFLEQGHNESGAVEENRRGESASCRRLTHCLFCSHLHRRSCPALFLFHANAMVRPLLVLSSADRLSSPVSNVFSFHPFHLKQQL